MAGSAVRRRTGEPSSASVMRCQGPGFTHLSDRMTGKQSIRDLPPGRALYHQEPDEIKIGDTGKISVGLDRSPTTTARRSATRSPTSPPELIKTTQIRKCHRWLSAMARQHAPARAAPPRGPSHARRDARKRVVLPDAQPLVQPRGSTRRATLESLLPLPLSDRRS